MQEQQHTQIIEQQQGFSSRRPNMLGDRGRGPGAQISNTGSTAGANAWIDESTNAWTDGANTWTSS